MKALLLALALVTAAAQPRSGYEDAGPVSRAMQDDDAENPAFLWIEQGRGLWTDAGCAGCHGAVETLRGVAARYPAVTAAGVMTLAQRVNECRTARQHVRPWDNESEEMLALTALIGLQSRGLPVAIDTSAPEAKAAAEEGRALFHLRQGQLNLACASCHDDLAGRRLGGAVIPQGHPNAYPIYRLDWQALGSLERRLRQCVSGMRAAPLAPESRELGVLEFFLAIRSTGLKIETPGVRP